MRSPAFLVAARRTPVAPRGGAFSDVDLFDLAVPPLLAALSDAGIVAGRVNEVIIGNAIGPGGNPARSIALAAGLAETTAGLTLDRQCCSGLDALLLAEALIAGGADVVLAGGVEQYSRRSHRRQSELETGERDPLEQARFTPWPDRDPPMEVAADNLGKVLGISRQKQDAWTVESHRKALRNRHRCHAEIVPVPGIDLVVDSYGREMSMAICRRARRVCGSITAANTSVAADGGAICAVVSERIARELDRPAVRIAGGMTIGGDPDLPGLAPVDAIAATLDQAGLEVQDLAVAEIMEAYAVQAIACVNGVGLSPSIVNPGGGSLARGHPIGASGAVLAVRLFHELAERRARFGIASIAAAGGLGTAVLLEYRP